MKWTAKQRGGGERIKRLLVTLQIFIGLGGVAGGLGLVLDPSGENVGLQLEWLSGSPFESYLLPGWVLLLINGFGNLAGGFVTKRGLAFAGNLAILLGVFLMCWISVQVWWIGLRHWLQPLYFGLGSLEAWLAWVLLHRSRP